MLSDSRYIIYIRNILIEILFSPLLFNDETRDSIFAGRYICRITIEMKTATHYFEIVCLHLRDVIDISASRAVVQYHYARRAL